MTSSRAAIGVTMVESKEEERNDIDVQLILDVISRALLIGVKKNAGMENIWYKFIKNTLLRWIHNT